MGIPLRARSRRHTTPRDHGLRPGCRPATRRHGRKTGPGRVGSRAARRGDRPDAGGLSRAASTARNPLRGRKAPCGRGEREATPRAACPQPPTTPRRATTITAQSARPARPRAGATGITGHRLFIFGDSSIKTQRYFVTLWRKLVETPAAACCKAWPDPVFRFFASFATPATFPAEKSPNELAAARRRLQTPKRASPGRPRAARRLLSYWQLWVATARFPRTNCHESNTSSASHAGRFPPKHAPSRHVPRPMSLTSSANSAP